MTDHDARSAYTSGYALVMISCLFLVAVGAWGAARNWPAALFAAAGAVTVAWCAGGELHDGDVLAERAEQADAQITAWFRTWQDAGVVG